MKNQFSNNLRTFRLQNKLNQSELGKVLGTTQRKISYWEMGKTEPDLDSLIKIADYFDITIDDLLGR